MIERSISPTPSRNTLSQQLANFSTLTEALDYAAQGQTGANFYDGRGRLKEVLPYAVLQQEAVGIAKRLHAMGLQRGARVALTAHTDPAFLRLFYGCQYGGFVPVPLPIPASLGNQEFYVERLRHLLQSCTPAVLVAPAEMLPLAAEAAAELPLVFLGSIEELQTRQAPADVRLEASRADEVAYLQYTSGSTRFPRGVKITQRAVMANLQGITGAGLGVGPGDRCLSWLPFYHDMGLVGFVLGPMSSQLSVDYMGNWEFAMRPWQWLELINRNRATISFAPPFGYDWCVRRFRGDQAAQLDLSCWRVAGVAAEPIRPDILDRFAEVLAASGFDRRAFLPCYGLAENTLAVSFAQRNAGICIDRVDRLELEHQARALPAREGQEGIGLFVNCGAVLPGHELVIRDDHGRPLPERWVGRITVRGPSLMTGYLNDEASTGKVLDQDGWLDTGDLGYLRNGELYVTGRKKDLIIINGRNIWPQDIEHLAERQANLRPADAIVFQVPGETEPEIVMLVQCRLGDPNERDNLVNRLNRLIYSAFGVSCRVKLVPPHSLPRTSSGKPARFEARQRFLGQQTQTDARAPTRHLRRVGDLP